jgi:predicted RNA polymerase sigma factor
MSEVHAAIEVVWRNESARFIAAIARVTRDVDIAEELAQDAPGPARESPTTRPRGS